MRLLGAGKGGRRGGLKISIFVSSVESKLASMGLFGISFSVVLMKLNKIVFQFYKPFSLTDINPVRPCTSLAYVYSRCA